MAASEPVPVLDPWLAGLADLLAGRRAATGEQVRVRHVDWQPGRRCTVVHEARLPGGATVFTAHEVSAEGTEVATMQDDPVLAAGLRAAGDGREVCARLARTSLGTPTRCEVSPVSYRPGSRAVLVYDVTGPAGPKRLYAKLLTQGSGAYARAAHDLLATARERGAAAPVPEVVAVWEDLGAVVQQAVPGRALSQVLGDSTVAVAERLSAARRLGELLACVHAAPAGGARTWSTDDELGQLELLLAPAWHADPAAGRALASTLDRLACAAPPLSDVVLGHGAFRTGQVVHDDGRLSLLDLDSVGPGDAARDAGNAVAYLVWAQLRGALPAGLAHGVTQGFLDAYASVRAPLDPDALSWWSAASLAKIAGRRYRSLAVAHWPLVPGLLDAARQRLDAGLLPAAGGSRPSAAGGTWPVDLLDAAAVTRSLRAALDDRHRGVRVVEARTAGEAAGRRHVLRYRVEGLGGGPAWLVGKVYADRHRSAVAYENLRLLADEVFHASPGLRVPARCAHLPALRMVLYREVDAPPLDLDDEAAAARGAAATARWLTTLHRSRVVLSRRVDAAHEVVNAGLWARGVDAVLPEAGPAALAVAVALARAAADLPPVQHVPVHKDLHDGHVLTGGGLGDAIVVIDLDEARMGDRALDVGHVRAYLASSGRAGAAAARDAFVSAYGPVDGPEPGLRTAFYEAYTCLKIAKQLTVGSGPLRRPAGPSRDDAVHAALRRGAECLGA